MQTLARLNEDDDFVEDNLPKAKDLRWKEWSDPLLAQLNEPRNLDWLQSWAGTQGGWGLVRQCLAWLSINNLAKPVGANDSVHWVKIDPVDVNKMPANDTTAECEPDPNKRRRDPRTLNLVNVQRISKEEILKQCDVWDNSVPFSALLLSAKEILGLPYKKLGPLLGTYYSNVHVWVRGVYKPRQDDREKVLVKLKEALLHADTKQGEDNVQGT